MQPQAAADHAHRAAPDSAVMAAQVASLRRDGVVVLPDVIDPARIDACAQSLAITGDVSQFEGIANWTNEGRFFAPLPLAGTLAEPDIFANPGLVAVASAALDGDCELDSFGVIVSLPGAPAQHMHVDGRLFPKTPCDRLIPAYALTFAIPLVDLDETTGSTGFMQGSHLQAPRDGEPDFIPRVPRGSAMLWDYRVRHRGEANRSDRPRPVLFGIFCRAWWQDARNFEVASNAKLQCDPAVLEQIDPQRRPLLRRAMTVPASPQPEMP